MAMDLSGRAVSVVVALVDRLASCHSWRNMSTMRCSKAATLASDGTKASTAVQQALCARASTALSIAPPAFVFTSISASRPWLK